MFNIKEVINGLEPEYRIPVQMAYKTCDGSVLSFQQELSAMTWDYPRLPVQDILDRVVLKG